MTMLGPAPLFRFLIAAVVILAAGAVTVSVVKRKSPTAGSSDATAAAADAIVARLGRLDGYPFDARYSEGRRGEAERLARLMMEAYEYFIGVFDGARPQFVAIFLAPADWTRGYGMPSYHPVEKRLRVATDDNALWQSFGRIARVASPVGAYPKIKQTYADSGGHLQLRRFFDLLAVHELAHAFEEQGAAAFPTHWLRELFANLALHAFVARVRPTELANLTTFPEAQTSIAAFNVMMRITGYTTLDHFDRHYPAGNTKEPMSEPNYGWYQVRFHVAAREIFDDGGEAALARLWAFGKSEAAHRRRASDYFREHGTLTGWSAQTRANDLAARLASEVSPRLGQTVAAWH